MFSFFRKGKKRNLSFSPPQKLPAKKPDAKIQSVSAAAPEIDLTGVKAVGNVDVFEEARIAGWALYIGHMDTPAKLDFYFDDRLIGTIVADQYRPDLEKAGHGTGRHSFVFTPPDGLFSRSTTIEVRAANSQTIGRFEKKSGDS
jgi:hypothetical protein